jgi:hypothetical protein
VILPAPRDETRTAGEWGRTDSAPSISVALADRMPTNLHPRLGVQREAVRWPTRLLIVHGTYTPGPPVFTLALSLLLHRARHLPSSHLGDLLNHPTNHALCVPVFEHCCFCCTQSLPSAGPPSLTCSGFRNLSQNGYFAVEGVEDMYDAEFRFFSRLSSTAAPTATHSIEPCSGWESWQQVA